MKLVFKFTVSVLLFYAIAMLFLDCIHSLLSLSRQTNIEILIEERVIPYSISIFSMIYCIIRMWKSRKYSNQLDNSTH